MYPDEYQHELDPYRARLSRQKLWFPPPDTGDSSPDQDDRLIDSAFLTIVHCRGVLVGDDNLQINSSVYRIDQPTVDLTTVLKKPAVRKALAALGQADPDSFEAARRDAEHELAAGSWQLVGHSLIDLGDVAPETRLGLRSMLSALAGAVLIEDCQGVQVGSHNSQYNHFQYVCPAAPIDAVQLLAGNYALAHAIVEQVVSGGSNGAIDRALNDTLMRSAELKQLSQPSNISTDYCYGTIANRDAVAVGTRNRIRSTVTVSTALNDTRAGILRDLASLQHNIATARNQHSSWQEAERRSAIAKAIEEAIVEAPDPDWRPPRPIKSSDRTSRAERSGRDLGRGHGGPKRF